MSAHLRRLIDPALLILTAVFASGLRLALAVGLFGVPLALIVVSWLFKYAYALLEDVAYGIQKPRVMSIEMVNPIEQRPLAQLAICLAGVMAIRAVDGWPAIVLGGISVGLLPASVAILGASGSVIQAVNPLALIRVAVTLGRYYLLVLICVAVIALGAWGLVTIAAPLTLQFAYLIFAILAIFNMIGGALYERRDALDLPTVVSPEQTRERDQRYHVRERSRFVDELYAFARARRYAELEAVIERWFGALPVASFPEDGLALVTAARSWGDTQALCVIARSVIDRLHNARLSVAALDAFECAATADPEFHLPRCDAAIELVELAVAAGRRPLARRILASCVAHDPDEYGSKRLARLRQVLER